MGTSQIATEACDFRPEGADGHRGRRVSRALGYHRKHQRLNHLVSWALWFGTRVATDLQQAYGQRGQQTQQAYQAVNTLQLSLFNATPTFETLVIVLGQPTMPIPVHPLPGLLERRGGHRGQQDPFQRLLAIWCLLFPDANDPRRHGIFAHSRLMAWGQERHLTKGKLQLGRACWVSMPGGNLKGTTRLTWPGPCSIQRIADLVFALLDAPILSCSHQKVRLRRLTGLKEGEHIRPPISDMYPRACRLRCPNALHLAYPDIGFSLFPLAPLVPLFSPLERECAQRVPGPGTPAPRASGDARPAPFAQKTPSSFIADLSHAADLVTMGKINVGGILHQQHHRRGKGLFSGLLKVWLHQGSKGDIWLIQQPIQGFTLFPGLHLSRQRTQRILRQLGFPLGPLVSCNAYHAVGHPQRFARPSSWGPTLLV